MGEWVLCPTIGLTIFAFHDLVQLDNNSHTLDESIRAFVQVVVWCLLLMLWNPTLNTTRVPQTLTFLFRVCELFK